MTQKLRIKPGTRVYQDFKFFDWPGPYRDKVNTLFEVSSWSDDSLKCIARGFGRLGTHRLDDYGNGAVWVKTAHMFGAKP